MRHPFDKLRAPSFLVALGLASLAMAADQVVKDFKKAWDEAEAISAADKKSEAELKALDLLKAASTPEAAQAALGVALDQGAHWRTHDAALAVLKTMVADPVKAWAQKEIVSGKEARVRAVLCPVAAEAWPDGWKLIVPALKDKELSVVLAAVASLEGFQEKDVVAALVKALKDAKDARLQGDLQKALVSLTGMTFTAPAEWESWWKDHGEGFTFEKKAPVEKKEPENSVPKTTSNGSGLYETISSNRVIFIIDTSYSMRTTGEVQQSTEGAAAPKKQTLSRLEYVQRELCAAIDVQLSKKCFFNVIQFNTKVSAWKPKLVDASDGNRKAAKAWVMALQPEAETNTYDALDLAFQDKQVDTIYLLTDGFPTHGKIINMDAIRGEVRKWNEARRVKIHTICYVVGDGKKFAVVEDKGMSKHFMEKLAADNGGTCKIFE